MEGPSKKRKTTRKTASKTKTSKELSSELFNLLTALVISKKNKDTHIKFNNIP